MQCCILAKYCNEINNEERQQVVTFAGQNVMMCLSFIAREKNKDAIFFKQYQEI